MKPQEIEDLSFKIIDEEAGPHDFSKKEWPIVRRMIHTSADFEYMQSVRFHPDAINVGINAIRRGKNIITDTKMAMSGIRRKSIENFGGTVNCFISDPEISKIAKKTGATRAAASVDAAVDMMEGGIYVIGNAPTALLRLIQLINENKAKPALILGFPVGFVNAAESKSDLVKMDFPYISNKGRKGGSNIAAAVTNAMIILAENNT